MKKWIRFTALLALVGITSAILGYVFVYNKPHPDFEKAKAEYSLPANALFEAYRENTNEASEKYNGRVIELSGSLSEIEKNGEMLIAVFVFEEGVFGPEGIRINMLENQAGAFSEANIGQNITIKGYITGYNQSDVILEHGTIIEK